MLKQIKYSVTVITPTYNRAQLLEKLFESLNCQTDKDFQWLIIDDGSQDNTKQVVSAFSERANIKEIEYHWKENGGKHTALNYSHKYIKGDIVVLVDSDDVLVSDAIAVIKQYWEKCSGLENIGVISFLKGTDINSPLLPIEGNEIYSNHLSFRVNGKYANGDMLETVLSDVFKSVEFPEFQNEKFMGEGYLWMKLAYAGVKTCYVNKVIYLCDYLEGGLTKSGKKMRIANPIGGMENSKMYMNSQVCEKVRIKKTWLYICYGLFAHKSIRSILKDSGDFWFTFVNLPFGIMLYAFWKIKYK